MNSDLAIAIFMTLAATATPILLAALGELVVEKSGVMNIGLDGMMLIGAIATLSIVHTTGNYPLAVVGASLITLLCAMVFGLLTVWLGVNQIIAGLALALMGGSLSTLIGRSFIGKPIEVLKPLFPSQLSESPLLRIVFGHSWPVYFALVMVLATAWFINRTRAGILLRATGEDPTAVHAMGHQVRLVRMVSVGFGGLMAGLAGSCFPLMLTPQWSDGVTSGRGWVALALVSFAGWRPGRVALGAYFFSVVLTLEIYAKAGGVKMLPAEAWAALPYVTTIVALILISLRRASGSSAPACLGQPFNAR